MAEWPADLLSGADAARPLGPEIRARVEDVLLDAEVLEPRPLDAAVDQRLEAALGDPVAVAMAGIDGPRTLPAGTHGALLENLGRRRRHLVPLVSAAAGLVVLAGVGALLATSTDRTPTPTRSAAHALGTAP
ncbi:MAG TPA: hypothetical protein VMV14_11075, partial [Acidimicrobiales bacterium]|nr:hypothetical protein [Acidimicrobiales bacterium]